MNRNSMKSFFPVKKLTVALATVAILCGASATLADARDDSVYSRVYSVLTSFKNRRVGTEALDRSFEAIEAELRAAGLEPKYETFNSLSQQTDKLDVSYGGAPLSGALMIDNGSAAFVIPEPIRGKAVYVGSGSVKDLDGRSLDGAIAVVDTALDGASVRECFTHGAKAAILVGDPSVRRQSLGAVGFQTITLVPRIWLDRSEAQSVGLLDADGTKELVIDARAVITDVRARNLWVELPSQEGWQGRLESEEVLVLSTTLDTYGFTPDVTPDRRGAANAALLAEVACALAKGEPLNRHVVVVFFGSKSSAQEGARYFYHAVDMAESDANPKGLQERAKEYQDTLKTIDALLDYEAHENIIAGSGAEARDLQQRLKKQLIALSNHLRSPLGDLRTKKSDIENGRLKVSDSELAQIKSTLAELEARRMACNTLREQLVSRQFDDSDPVVKALYAEMCAEVRGLLELRKSELQRMIEDNATWQELSKVFVNRAFVGHFNFDFADASSPWMLSMLNASHIFRARGLDTGSYGRHLAAVRSIYYGTNGIAIGKDWKAKLYEPALNSTYKPFSLSLGAQRMTPSVLSTSLGYAGFEMMTVGDELSHDSLPYALNVDLWPLCEQMEAFCRELGNSLQFSLRRVYSAERREPRLIATENAGVHYQTYAAGSTDNEGTPVRAIANFVDDTSMPPFMVGENNSPRTRIQANGRIYLPYVGKDAAANTWHFRNLAIGYDKNGAVDRVPCGGDYNGIINTPVHLFYSYGGLHFGTGYVPDPVGGSGLYTSRRLIANKDADFKMYLSLNKDGFTEFFADRTDPVKFIGGSGDFVLGSTTNAANGDKLKAAMGSGLQLDAQTLLHTDTIAQGANDAYLLNEARLSILRERNIVRDDLEKLHADAKDHVEAATQARSARKWSLARAHEIFATCIENRIYLPLRNVTEDLVQAVVVLLLLNIPFAFAMERLCFGFPSIYKQILGFIGFFIATFAVLYITHPAFSLASAPIVIFLAFVIIMLACITTAIMMGKIRQEIRALQGLSSTVHGATSDSSTTLSAILIGIAGMRNRPLKTFLTCITVVLLTFTILVFASFTPQQGVVSAYLGRGADENRIEIHRLSFLDIDAGLIRSLNTLYGDRFDISTRGGLFRIPSRGGDTGATPTNAERLLFLPKSGESTSMSAIMGAGRADFEHSEGFRKTCSNFVEADDLVSSATPGTPEAMPPIWLPELVKKDLTQLEVGDEIRLNGVPFVFKGFFDSTTMQTLSTIEGLRVVPPDFQTTLANSGSSSTSSMSVENMEEMSSGSFEWFSPEVIALCRMDDLKSIFGNDLCAANFITLYPKSEDIDLDAVAEELAPAIHGSVHVKSPEGAHRLFFSKTVEGSGFADVVVPLLLGGLIIFSSLMGSIVAREKEIFTYSALGLAPVDVGALFFAESAVYSVIGGMGGYLLSQIVAKFVKFLATKGLITPLEMNFSSLTSVCTILIVMAVVMLSTIVPALRASKSANPGVARKWKMPSPEGDKLEFVFPFTVSSVDFAGIISFIREHFNNHADATLGAFAARDVRLFREKAPSGKDRIGIEANISLAPFDLGIFQRFRMYSQEFNIPGIDEVVVDLRRVGGTPLSWIRSNRDFAAELREQFLLWRSLPIETIEHYRAQTAQTLDGQVSDEGKANS